MMSGWKTWIAAIGAVCLGIYEITEGQMESGVGRIVFGLSLVGLGHKLDKLGT